MSPVKTCKCGQMEINGIQSGMVAEGGNEILADETHGGCMRRRDPVSVLYSLSSLLPAL